MYRETKVGLCLVLCTIAFTIVPSYAQEAFVIKDEGFIDRSFSGIAKTEVRMSEAPGGVNVSGYMHWERGRHLLWGNGAQHTLQGTIHHAGHTFESDKNDPLQFRVDKDKGYVYVKGRGVVTMPEGKVVRLP